MTRAWQRMAGAVLAVVLASGAGAAALAAREQGPFGPGGQMGRRGPGGRGGAMLPLRGLDLTEAQREQVKAAVDGHQAEFAALRTRLRAAQATLHAATTADVYNEGAVRQAAADVAAAEADGAVLRAKLHTEVWALLTPEQQQKARDLRAEREKRAAERRQQFEQRRNQRQQQRQQRG